MYIWFKIYIPDEISNHLIGHTIYIYQKNFHFLCHRYKESYSGSKLYIFYATVTKKVTVAQNYIAWPIKWLEILLGIWILNQNFKIGVSIKFIYKYMGKVILFNEFCKNFQGKFFLKSQHQFSGMNCTYLYRSLLSGIFLNSYPIKAHCEGQHL